jgi:hypothetical protein
MLSKLWRIECEYASLEFKFDGPTDVQEVIHAIVHVVVHVVVTPVQTRGQMRVRYRRTLRSTCHLVRYSRWKP